MPTTTKPARHICRSLSDCDQVLCETKKTAKTQAHSRTPIYCSVYSNHRFCSSGSSRPYLSFFAQNIFILQLWYDRRTSRTQILLAADQYNVCSGQGHWAGRVKLFHAEALCHSVMNALFAMHGRSVTSSNVSVVWGTQQWTV